MTYEVSLTNQADSDLRSIYEYIAFDLYSPQHAEGQLNRLEEKILKLEVFPFSHPEYENEPWKSRGLRFMPVDNYIVFFMPNVEKLTVTIIRVMYGGRDVDSQLKNHTRV